MSRRTKKLRKCKAVLMLTTKNCSSGLWEMFTNFASIHINQGPEHFNNLLKIRSVDRSFTLDQIPQIPASEVELDQTPRVEINSCMVLGKIVKYRRPQGWAT